jgi:hypothetical protein
MNGLMGLERETLQWLAEALDLDLFEGHERKHGRRVPTGLTHLAYAGEYSVEVPAHLVEPLRRLIASTP